jgi:hypothetical protein
VVPFCCRNGHIPLRGDHLAREGRLARASALSLDARCILNRMFCSSNQTGTQLSSICEVETSTWYNAETPQKRAMDRPGRVEDEGNKPASEL